MIRHASRDIRIRASGRQENAEIPHRVAFRKSHNRQPHDRDDGVEREHRRTHPVLVAEPGSGEHEDGGGEVRGGDKTLGFADPETHTVREDDREEVGDCVSYGREAAKDHCETPDFQVESWTEEFPQVPGFRVGVAAVTVETANDKVAFGLVEESPGFISLIGEIDDKDVAEDADCEGNLGCVSQAH